MSEFREVSIPVGDVDVVTLRGGTGRPLLVLHDELGFSGWTGWAGALAERFELIVPLQPGFGRTPRVEWARDYRDLASFYLRLVREMELPPVDIVGFSAGGYLAAEMVAASPESVSNLILVAPLGLRPSEGEIFDFLAVTARAHLRATVSRHDAPEVMAIYGGEMTPEQFALFEAARAETSRLGWEPFMFSPSLGHRLAGLTAVRSLLVWGDANQIVPRGCIDEYHRALHGSQAEIIAGCGHRPEVESPEDFVRVVSEFLAVSSTGV